MINRTAADVVTRFNFKSMKALSALAIVLLSSALVAAQERILDRNEFDPIFNAAYKILDVWKEKAFRKNLAVEARRPESKYKLGRIFEMAADGSTRTIHNEHVEGKEPRVPREVIGIGKTSFIRDIGKSSWWVRTHPRAEEINRTGAYVPDPDEAHAVRDHFVRDRYEIAERVHEYKFVGIQTRDASVLKIYTHTEKIKGIEKKSGRAMETEASMRYWFRSDGMLQKAESVSNGRIGDDVYYLKITAVWEIDSSIAVTPPDLSAKPKANVENR